MKSLFIFLGTSLLAVSFLAAETVSTESEGECQSCGHSCVVACKCGGKCGCGK